MLKFGPLAVDPPLALAPMAGVTSWPFRLLCKELGCGVVVTEFVSDMALQYDSKRTLAMIELLPQERPAGVQLFGAAADSMARAAQIVVDRVNPEFIDINMGCPAPKITRGRGGSSLLREPCTAQDIVRAVVRQVAPKPVTVKIRIGWDASSINAVEVARRAEDAGAVAVTVHGRTREQHYSGEADWEVIAAVAAALRIPVIGNGDISTPEQAMYRLRTSGCHGVAIGRGALGNPWLFRRTAHCLQTGELLPEPTGRERVEMALRHMALMVEYRGEYIGVREMRKHAAWYLKGLYGSAEARNAANQAETAQGMRDELLRFLDRYERAPAGVP